MTDAEYRKRIWVYVSDQLSGTGKEYLQSRLKDVGPRVDKVDARADKGFHANMGISEVQRLLMGESVLLYDLLMMAPPHERSQTLSDLHILLEMLEADAKHCGEG